MRRCLLLLVAAASVAVLLAASSAPAEPAAECTWGASSVIVEQVGGKLVQSEPATSGCVPPR